MKKLILLTSVLCLTSCGGYKDKAHNTELTPEESAQEFSEKERKVISKCSEKSENKTPEVTSELLENCIKPKHLELIQQYVGIQDLDLYNLKYDSEIAIRKKIESGQIPAEDGKMLISRSVAEISSELQKRMLLRQQVYGTLSSQNLYNQQFSQQGFRNIYNANCGY